MNLWMVITILNEVAATFGPFDVDMDLCEQYVEAIVADGFSDALPPLTLLDGRTIAITHKDIRWYCTYSDARPQLGPNHPHRALPNPDRESVAAAD